MVSEHTAKAFDSDLQELTRLVAEMGGLAERMIVESVDALIRRDVTLGKRVVAADAEIDSLQRVIEERYSPDNWNIYAAQASDGDNTASDNDKTAALLTQVILPAC